MPGVESPIAKWYDGRCVFITGASGFMGKVLVEKLLYSCTGIKTVYILLRNKRGKTPQQRLEIMWNLPCFSRLRESQPDAIKKIVPLNGDLSTDGLGLTAKDIDLLLNDVSVVFHLGATLKLEANLKDAINFNTNGTARVIDICKKIKNLKAFLHFSTAFCSADLDVFEERVYPSKEKPRDVIKVAEWLNLETLKIATPGVISPHPNTYTYSKRLAETLIADEVDNMPVAIIRPSIVIPAVDEPVPGWVDSLNGPVGLLVGAGKGVIRSMYCNGGNRGQFIPVDFAINTTIVVAQMVGKAETRSKEVPVYNLTQDAVMPLTYQEILNMGRSIYYEYPFEMQIWYPDGDIRSSKLVHNIYSILFHWLPALLIDLIMFVCGQKRFMMRIQKKIYDGLNLLEFFATKEWIFKSEKFLALNNYLTEEDKKIFTISEFRKYSLKEYLINGLLGTRQYCLKEDLSSLPRCRQKQKILYIVHVICVYGFYLLVFYFFGKLLLKLLTVFN
ncbi:putative fatty acyl-CoA reductase CG5065 [Anoplophora glabripennis]|uniref:putative fatty acyl-CoA reductase CG5065 n=1 Tax=Anoplophora glabripennis TaxID=217634 RepID=UPI0008748D57|nr:putative fatty acyl-CoA reductase CG5065 [Anoplophora glabripennis]XP_018563271.1 putative fatty acyl-CoA reductase CG5065 [Anoplophora glabripennis]